MNSDYKLRLFNRAGALQYEITDFRSLAWKREVNAAGLASVVLNAAHPAVAALQLDWYLEIWRRSLRLGVNWRLEFSGFFRDMERRADENGQIWATLVFPGLLSLLGRAIVAYKAGVSSRSSFSGAKAETIAKNLVTYNLTPWGTVLDGRLRAAEDNGVTLERNDGRGTTLDFACAYRNVLEALQDVAAIGGGDFDLIRTAARTWNFRWYPGQRGSDRAASVTFSLAYGNMAEPALRMNTLNERTVAIVGGQGEGEVRSTVLRTGAGFLSLYNAAELFVDGRNYATTAGLESAGDAALDARRGRQTLTFSVVQTEGSAYGLHYDWGDRVTAVFEEYSAIQKITAVLGDVSEKSERLLIEMKDV